MIIDFLWYLINKFSYILSHKLIWKKDGYFYCMYKLTQNFFGKILTENPKNILIMDQSAFDSRLLIASIQTFLIKKSQFDWIKKAIDLIIHEQLYINNTKNAFHKNYIFLWMGNCNDPIHKTFILIRRRLKKISFHFFFRN